MSFTLFYLPKAPSSSSLYYDYANASDAMVLTSSASSTLALMPSTGRLGDAVVVVPVNMLSWHCVELPKGVGRTAPRLRTILSSLLEERLLDETEQLHFAIAADATKKDAAGSTYWVAVCDKHWLVSHLQALESAGVVVGRIVPEFAPSSDPADTAVNLNVIEGSKNANETGQPLLVVTGHIEAGVMCLPLAPAPVSGALLWQQDADLQGELAVQTVCAEPALAALAERHFGGQVSLKNRPQRWLEACSSGWDLAQFDLATSGRVRTAKRLAGAGRQFLFSPQWRPARWGLAALAGVNLLGLNFWAWQEQSTQQAQRVAIETTFTQTFPQVKVVIDATQQMQREVAALKQSAGASSSQGLEAVLAALGGAANSSSTAGAGAPARSFSGVEMSNGDIKIKGFALSPQAVVELSAQFKTLGYDTAYAADVLRVTPATPQKPAP